MLWSHTNDSYGSHQPVLMEILRVVKPKRIIELGCGYYSSSVLNFYAKTNDNIDVVAIEYKSHWFDMISKLYRCDNYNFILHNDLYTLPNVDWDNLDLLLIDQGDWYSRCVSFVLLKQQAKVVMMHDCDWYLTQVDREFIKDKHKIDWPYRSYSDMFKFYQVFDSVLPPTLVGSDVYEFPRLHPQFH